MIATLTKKISVENNRSSIVHYPDRLELDEEQLEIFSYYDNPIPEWKPSRVVKPYDQLKIFHLDIETNGGILHGKNYIDADNFYIALIGVKDQHGRTLIFDAIEDEALALTKFFRLLEKHKPDILNVYNGFFFDIPFIIRRAELHGISHPFYIPRDKLTGTPLKKIRRTAQVNSRATEYVQIFLSFRDMDGFKPCAIVDSYHEVLAWDFVKRTLTGYRLKEVPIQMDLTKDEVIDLSFPEMLERIDRWDTGGKEELSKYLESDLNLTKIIGDALIPPVYYQSVFLDWKLQSIISSGNGSKWNSMIESYYKEKNLIYIAPDAFEKKTFQGAYTSAYAGFYYNENYQVSEFDILSLYPHIMLLYGISSIKDIDKVFLSMLAYLLKGRIDNKKLFTILEKLSQLRELLPEEKSDKSKYDGMQSTMKVLANSGYGQFGTRGLSYNDYEAAALVTGYGRAIFRHIVRTVAKLEDVKFCSLDTDGFKVYHPKGKAQEICDYINTNLPGNDAYKILVKIEWTAKCFFVPESKNPKALNADLIKDGDMGMVRSGLKKNYIIIMEDPLNPDGSPVINEEGKPVKGKLKFNGKYRKRDRSKLEKEFQPQFIKLLVNNGEMTARKYYAEIRQQLIDQTYPVEKLAVTRKIKETEINLIKAGVGVVHEVVTIHKSPESRIEKAFKNELSQGQKGGFLKNPKFIWTNKQDSVGWHCYIKTLDDMLEEIMRFIDPDMYPDYCEQPEIEE